MINRIRKNHIVFSLFTIMLLFGCGRSENVIQQPEGDNGVISWFENDKDGGLSGNIVTYDYYNHEITEKKIDFRISAQSNVGDGKFVGIVYSSDSTDNHIALYDSVNNSIEKIISINRIKDQFGGKGCTDNQQIKMSSDNKRLYFQGGKGIIKYDWEADTLEMLIEASSGNFFISDDEERLYYMTINEEVQGVIACKDLITNEETELIRDVLSFDVSPDESTIVYSDAEYKILHYDVKTKNTYTIKNKVKPIPVIRFSDSGKEVMYTNFKGGLTYGSYKPLIYIYDISSRKEKLVHKGSFDIAILGICWIKDDN